MEPLLKLEEATAEQVARLNTSTGEHIPEEWKGLAESTLLSYKEAAGHLVSLAKELNKPELAQTALLYKILTTGRGTSITTNGREIGRAVMKYITAALPDTAAPAIKESAEAVAEKLSSFITSWKENAISSLKTQIETTKQQITEKHEQIDGLIKTLVSGNQRIKELQRPSLSGVETMYQQLQQIEANGFWSYESIEDNSIVFLSKENVEIAHVEHPELKVGTGQYRLYIPIEGGRITVSRTESVPNTPNGNRISPSCYLSADLCRADRQVEPCFGETRSRAYEALSKMDISTVANIVMELLSIYVPASNPYSSIHQLMIGYAVIEGDDFDNLKTAHPSVDWNDFSSYYLDLTEGDDDEESEDEDYDY